MTGRLLERDQIEPIALFLLDHTRGFDHALVRYSTCITSHFRRAHAEPNRKFFPLRSTTGETKSMMLPPLTLDLGLLLICIGAVNLWRARQGDAQ